MIVPAYNVEDYLEECLDSVLAQKLRGVEVLVVDDGSSDSTPQIVERYCRKYRAVRSFRLERGGVAAARNLGLDNARGRYVCFLDGDDKLRPNALKAMYDRAESLGADLVFANYVSFDGMREWGARGSREVFSAEALGKYDPKLLWLVAVWAKLFRRSVVDEHRLRFTEISFAEDALFYMSFAWVSQRIVTLEEQVYCYRHRPFTGQLSIVQSVTAGSLQGLQEGYRLMRERATEQLSLEMGAHSADLQMLPMPSRYVEALLRKEALTLLNLQYRRLGTAAPGAGTLIADRLEDIRGSLSYGAWTLLVREFSSLCLEDVPETLEEASARALVTVAVWDEALDPSALQATLESLVTQQLPRIRVVVPARSMKSLEQAGVRIPGYVVACECISRGDFYDAALQLCGTEFFILSQSGLSYAPDAVRKLHRAIEHTNHDAAACSPGVLSSLNSVTHSVVMFRSAFLSAAGIRFADSIDLDVGSLCNEAYVRVVKDTLVYPHQSGSPGLVHHVSPGQDQENAAVATGSAAKRRSSIQRQWLRNRAIDLFSGLCLRLARRMPLRRVVFLYTSRSDGRQPENLIHLFDALKGSRRVMVASRHPHRRRLALSIKMRMLTSKVIVLDNYDMHYLRHMDLRDGQHVVQVWHACGAFKRFGFDAGPTSFGDEVSAHRHYDAVIASSEFAAKHYARAFGVAPRAVHALGVPRTDFFYDAAAVDAARAYVYQRHPELEGRKVILYAPTFRDTGGDRTVFKSGIDFPDLARSLPPDTVFVISRHPLITRRLLGRSHYDNLLEIEGLTTGELMPVADLLITDYSTVIFEYLLLNRPIALYCPDLAEYDRGFYFDFPSVLPASVLHDHEELKEFIMSCDFQCAPEDLQEFRNMQMGACDGCSAARVAGFIRGYLHEGRAGR